MTVIVPEATPAVSVCGAVVKTNWLAAAGLTVSCCVAEATPPAAVAVIVGVPAAASVYLKLAVPRRPELSAETRARRALARCRRQIDRQG